MKLINADCIDALKTLDADSVDLTVTSPPYDSLRTYGGSNCFNIDKFKQAAKELVRVTKPGGVIVWVVGDATIKGSETGTSFRHALFFKDDLGMNLHDTMIYYRNGCTFPETNRYYPCFEYMFVFSKGKPKTVNLIRDRENKYAGTINTSTQREKDGTIRRQINAIKGKRYEKYGVRFNLWKINSGFNKSTTDKIAYGHPAIFPEKLAMDHILSWSNVLDTVLDPFMGSGTTGKMAKILDRKFIGIEKETEYFEIAKARIDNT